MKFIIWSKVEGIIVVDGLQLQSLLLVALIIVRQPSAKMSSVIAFCPVIIHFYSSYGT